MFSIASAATIISITFVFAFSGTTLINARPTNVPSVAVIETYTLPPNECTLRSKVEVNNTHDIACVLENLQVFIENEIIPVRISMSTSIIFLLNYYV